jgi:DNA-directed RNA polymerase subunit A"
MTELAEAVVEEIESADLPRRLKDRVRSTVEDREDVTAEAAGEIVSAVEARYRRTRVDPLEPVGTVSAQSIGEPGTQMSLPADERVLVRQNGERNLTAIGPLIDRLMEGRETRRHGDHEISLAPRELEVLSLRSDEEMVWKPVEELSRHRAPDELLEITLASGRSVRATKAHSFVIKQDEEIVPIAGDELTSDDRLPTTGEYDSTTQTAEFGSYPTANQPVTDGGVALSPAKRSHRASGDFSWERIDDIQAVETSQDYVYDFSVEGLETFTTAQGIVTHNTMNTFHYAGVAEIDVTQGLPRLIELVDARKTPDTPMMSIYLDDEHATDRSKAHEVVWKLEATRILALGDVSTNVADMLVRIDLNPDTLEERQITAEEVAETIESHLDVDTALEDAVIEFGPDEPSYRQLLQLVEQLRDIVFKGLEEVSRVVIRKEQREDTEDEFVLYTEGSDFGAALEIEGVDATRSTTNNIHEVHETLGIEAARESIIEETMSTLEEQGLDDVNIRHLMLVADIMTTKGTIESIGRHGISGNKESVLARAAFEVTVNHLLDAAVHGEVDDLNGVTENVIVGKPIKLGTGDVDLRMHSKAD